MASESNKQNGGILWPGLVTMIITLGACGGVQPDSKLAMPDSTQSGSNTLEESTGKELTSRSEGDVSIKALCTEPRFLLSRNKPSELLGQTLPKSCCSSGGLTGEDRSRCVVKWPADEPFPCMTWKSMLEGIHAAGQDGAFIQRLTINERKLLRQSSGELLALYVGQSHCERQDPLTQRWPTADCDSEWFKTTFDALRRHVQGSSGGAVHSQPEFQAIEGRQKACLTPLIEEALAHSEGRHSTPRVHPGLSELPFLLIEAIMGGDAEFWMDAVERGYRHQLHRCMRSLTNQHLVHVPIITTADSLRHVQGHEGFQRCAKACNAKANADSCVEQCKRELAHRYARVPSSVEDPSATCQSRLSGTRPLKFYAKACALFDEQALKWPAEKLIQLGLEGHGVRPCINYLLRHGLSESAVADFIYEEALGKPNGGLIRRHFVEPARGTLADLIAFTEAEARVSQEQEHGFHCMGMHFLDEREARLKGKAPRLKAMRPWKRSVGRCIQRLKNRARKLKLK